MRRHRRQRWFALAAPVLTSVAVVLLAFVAVIAGGCAGPARPASRIITVLAASSLTEVFTSIGAQFESARPGTQVEFSFAGSSTLAQQITQGAPADVFASANSATMRLVADADLLAGPPAVFARNQLVIAVAPGNPQGITTLADLARPGLSVALCSPSVPCGAAAATALATGGVELTPVTFEADVRAALAKVRLGEVDAALVYRTDARAAGPAAVTAVEFPESAQASNEYQVAALRHASPEAAAFVAYLQSAPASSMLLDAGFLAP